MNNKEINMGIRKKMIKYSILAVVFLGVTIITKDIFDLHWVVYAPTAFISIYCFLKISMLTKRSEKLREENYEKGYGEASEYCESVGHEYYEECEEHMGEYGADGFGYYPCH